VHPATDGCATRCRSVRRERLIPIDNQRRLQACTRFDSVEPSLERTSQTFCFQVRRAQLEQQRAHLPKRLLRHLPNGAQLLKLLSSGPGCQFTRGRFGPQGQTIQSLSQRVVQLARQAIALVHRSQMLDLCRVVLQLAMRLLKFAEQLWLSARAASACAVTKT
jgi:hypothetical protein